MTLDELRKLESVETVREWRVVGNTLYCAEEGRERYEQNVDWFAFLGNAERAHLIAAARNALPALLRIAELAHAGMDRGGDRFVAAYLSRAVEERARRSDSMRDALAELERVR